MPAIKKSVMLSPKTQEYIDARTREDEEVAWSETLNETFDMLKYISQCSLPELSKKEWDLILSVYAGHIQTPFRIPFRIASDIMDALGVIEIDEVVPEIKEIIKKIHKMSQAEQYAIMDFVRKFWAKKREDYTDWEALVKQVQEG